MSIKTAKPSEVLRPFIKQYWGLNTVLPEGEHHTQRIIPCGLPELNLFIGTRPIVQGTKQSFEDDYILNGHHREHYDLRIEKDLSLFSIVFQPEGLMAFFQLPLIELYNQSIPLKYLHPKLGQGIQALITDEPRFEQRVLIVEKHFKTLLKEEYNRFEFGRINHAINLIRNSHGSVSIDHLASEACISRKQFERKFSDFIGITPKQYLKTIRLQYALFLKSQDGELSMTDIAYDSGHYDQAHFINEFKSMTGLTPKQYFDTSGAFSDFFDRGG